jgi:HK97 family phage portal protein
MFDFLKRKNDIPSEPIAKPEWADLSELNVEYKNAREETIEILKKQFDYTQFELSRDDQSNYFGLEFDIQTTSSRLKSLYVREPWVYATADRIARNASSVPLLIVDAKTEELVPNHPANTIVNSGSSFQDEISKRWVQYLDLILAGNAFLITDEPYTYAITVPTELVTLEARNDQKFDEIMKYGAVDYANIFGYGTTNIGMKVPYQQLLHFKLPNPFNPFYGLSPFAAASRPILLDRYKNEFEMAFYHRGASHSGVIENDQEISKEKMRRLIASFEQLYTGKRNWWRPLFLPKGSKWKASSLTMSEMQHLEGLRENRLTLLAVLGIPPSQVGIVQDVNRSTSEEQAKIFWQNTIVPLLNFYCAGFNNSYLFKYQYASAVKVIPDLTGIPALEGSMASKGETVNLLKEVLTINELRRDILGYDELPASDVRGNMFTKEITPNIFGTSISLPTNASTNEPSNTTGATTPEPTKSTATTKCNVELSKEKSISKTGLVAIEKTFGAKFMVYMREYEDQLLGQLLYALEEHRNVKVYLLTKKTDRLDKFVLDALPILLSAMDRGYVMSMLSTKRFTNIQVKASLGYEFTPEDEQAIEAVRAKTNDGRRKTLIQRGINNFYGWDETYTERYMKQIEEGLQAGKTNSEIAKEIKNEMDKHGGEAYRDQAFTITRTETLTAVSEGIKWSNDVLKTVFTEVNKVWLHIGDYNTNPDARDEHHDFELLGEKPSTYVYINPKTKGEMQYPRDPKGGASDTINCRCSMGNIIPKTSHSRATPILQEV